MADLPTTTAADITRLQAAVRSDRAAARAEIEQRLAAPDLPAPLRFQLRLLQGSAHLESGELAPALAATREVATWAGTAGEPLLQGRAQNILGLIHWRLGDLVQALEFFTTARRCGELVPDPGLELQATGNMSLIHAAQKQWTEAEAGFRHVLTSAEGTDDQRLLAVTANNLSFILWERDGPTDDALAFARRALAAKLPLQDWVSIAQTANNLAGLHCCRREYTEAHAALAEAAVWVQRANATTCNFYHALNRAQLLVSLDNPHRDDAAGFAAFTTALTTARDASMLEEEARTHEHIARAHAARGDHARGYEHLEHYHRLREKYLTDQSVQRIDKLRQAFKIERLEREHHAERSRREALETLNAALARTAHERDSLLRLVGHDLRSHVGGMIGLAELLRMDLPAATPTHATAEELCALGESTLSLLQEILEHGRALDGAFSTRENFDLVAAIREITHHLAPVFTAKQQVLTLDLPPGPVPATSNRSGLGRIVENLLTNASKFSPPGTPTALRLAPHEGGWQLAVIDHGQGIPAAEISRLFKPAQRLSVRPTGTEPSTGLGLVLVHEIATLIGVTLAHAPTPGGGATFLVNFPTVPLTPHPTSAPVAAP